MGLRAALFGLLAVACVTALPLGHVDGKRGAKMIHAATARRLSLASLAGDSVSLVGEREGQVCSSPPC